MWKRQWVAAVCILCFAGSVMLHAAAPWSVSRDAPVWTEASSRKRTPSHSFRGLVHPAMVTARFWLAVYQQGMHSVMQSKCQMVPSCSNYAINAFHEHGPLLGIILTADRLLREADEQRLYGQVDANGYSFTSDPVSNNDFWWK